MKLKKKEIQQRFNRASSSYDQVAAIQFKCARKLVQHLTNIFPEFYPSTVLDLGTGTGYVPQLLLPIFPSAQFTLNDLAPDMLKRTKEKIGKITKINFVQGDMDNLNFGHNQLITSNLSMQWTNDLEHTITKLNDNSDILAFSCLLDGTFKEWTKIFEGLSLPIPTYPYPSKEKLESFILSLGQKKYFFDSQEYIMEFASPVCFLKYLKELGASSSCQKIPFTDLRKILKTYQEKIIITYNVFFGILGRI